MEEVCVAAIGAAFFVRGFGCALFYLSETFSKNLRTNAINLRLTNSSDNGILKQPNKFNILISISVRILSFGKNAGFYSAYLYWLLNLFGDS